MKTKLQGDTLPDLADRVAELERRVKELEARPAENHTHFHTYPPVYQQPYAAPLTPAPYEPYRITWEPSPFGTITNSTIPLTTSVTSVRFITH